MKTHYFMYNPGSLWIGVVLLLMPVAKAFSQTGSDTVLRPVHVHSDTCRHEHEAEAEPYKTINLSDNLKNSKGVITEFELTAKGDTVYHYRQKAFDLGDVHYEGPTLYPDRTSTAAGVTQPATNKMGIVAQAEALNVDQDKSIGRIDFSEGMTPSGGKTYSIPIPTAPVASSAPQIALTYNSQSGNGDAGYGWNISGISSIAVVGKSIYYDNTVTPVDLTKPGDCQFVLDGVRLVANAGSLTEYQYETAQGFVLVKKYMSGSNIAYFTAAYPDGRVATFGYTNNTAMKHIYPLTEIKDLKGYIISYEYMTSGNNYYISKIRYGGKSASTHLAEIRFNYVTRSDYSTVYIGDVTISPNQLLKSVVSYNSIDGTSELRTYSLTHGLSEVQQLTQIDCKTGSASLNPLRFTYGSYDVGNPGELYKQASLFLSSYFSSTSSARPVYLRGKFVKNKYNDGMITFPGAFSPYGKTGEKVTKFLGIVTGRYPIYGSQYPADQSILIVPGLSFYSPTKTILTEEGFQTISAADVNGDGVDEIVKINFNGLSSDKTILKITKYSLADGSTLTTQTYNVQVTGVINSGHDTYSPISRSYYFGDFSGTGKIQLLTVSHDKDFMGNSKTSYFALINLENGTLIKESTLFSHATSDQSYVLPIDVDGDGKTEICYATTSGFNVYTLNSSNTFTSLSYPSSLKRSDFYRNVLIGDVNGDGKTDILVPPANSYQNMSYVPIPVWAPDMCYYCGTSNPITNEYSHYCRNCGYDVTQFISLYSLYCNECYSSLRSCDYGYYQPSSVDDACCPSHGRYIYKEIDLGYVNNGNGWTAHLSTGKRFQASTQNIVNTENGENYYLIDVNNDGKSDLVQVKNNRVKLFVNKNGILPGTTTINTITIPSGTKIVPSSVIDFYSMSHFICVENAEVSCYRFTGDAIKRNLLTSFTDSYGIRYENGYSYMTDNDNYITSTYSRYYPFFSLIAPLCLLRTSNVYMDYTPVKQEYYTWYGAVAHKTGLGFSGFEKVKTIEYVQNITTEEERNPELFGVTTRTDSPFESAYYYYYRNEGSNRKCNPQMTSSSVTDKLTGVYTYTSYQYDTYNNPTKSTQSIGSGSGISRVTDVTYSNLVTSSRYLTGQPLTRSVTNTRAGSSWIDKEVISYNSNRLPESRITYTGTSGSNKTGETRWTYDANGNITSEKSAPYNVTEFTGNGYTYDATGRYIATVTNALGQATTYSGYDKYGNPGSVKDHKNRTTTRSFDVWGRPTSVAYPDGVIETTQLAWGGTGLYTVTTTETGKPSIVVHYDALGREMRTSNLRFDGQWQYADKVYDSRGRLQKISLPFKGSSASYWNTYSYDSYNRPVQFSEASGKNTTWSYSGLSVTETRNGIASTKTTDASGALASVTDPGGTISYTLRPDGQPSSITAPGSVVTSFGYDVFGRQTSITDPSAGTQNFTETYTAAGVLTHTVTDANNKTVTSVFDKYGRITSATRPEFTTTYTYNSDGLLTGETSTNGTSQIFTYDTYDRPLTGKETVPDSKWLQREYTYSAGNVETVKYTSQSGLITTEHFTYTNGNHTETKLNGTTSVWKLTAENALGQPTQSATGNLTRTYSYTAYGIPTGRTAGSIQNFTYSFDAVKGNLLSRKDGTRNITETFGYDNLNRLTNAAGKSITYAVNGNITSMEGIGTLAYGNVSKPYQATMLTPSGDAVPLRDQSVTYTSFKRPNSIIENSYSAIFTYNAADDRVKMHITQNGNPILTRYYIGKQYETDIQQDIERLYLGGDAYSAPIIYVKEAGNWKIYYICRDYLGSVTHIANADGSLKAEYSYDAWGRLRNPVTQVAYTPGSEPSLFTGRGYTGHEHLPWFGLINMNARLYDPALGRFMSPDPYVQMPDFSQNFNRYSYCLNNPLIYTDEDGELFIIDSWISGFVKGLVKGKNPIKTANQAAMNDIKIWGGLFRGNFKQIVSRFTWELPQTLLGFGFAQVSNLAWQVDEVDYWGGATVTSGNNWGQAAVTLGSFIVGDKTIKADPNNPLFQHEYGHYLQSQAMGWGYLPRVGIPSLMSANGDGTHKYQPFEQDANRRAFNYFNKKVDGFYQTKDQYETNKNDGIEKGWDFKSNPLDVYHTATKGVYYDYHNPAHRDLIKSLSLSAKWYDYVGWLGGISGAFGVGFGNGLYYNKHRVK